MGREITKDNIPEIWKAEIRPRIKRIEDYCLEAGLNPPEQWELDWYNRRKAQAAITDFVVVVYDGIRGAKIAIDERTPKWERTTKRVFGLIELILRVWLKLTSKGIIEELMSQIK